ncbi:pectinesterase inhibitor 4-like [Prosopis cineraria]|uniref:pectinesterase inhibitor 4-like n=1 Tax=Prosopis cineraria TaxID=364024 RepID=UPI00240FB83B|nr:pectinesterase inhibitor 4-like [Prosopis cineraria]
MVTDFIPSACNTTDNSDLCYSSISPYAHVIKQSPAALALIGITVAHPVLRRVASDVSALSPKANGSYAGALSVCVETLGTALDDVGGGLYWMHSPKTECTDGFEDEPEGSVKKEVVDRVT